MFGKRSSSVFIPNELAWFYSGYITDSRGIRRHYGGDAVSSQVRILILEALLTRCAQAGGMHMYSATPMAAHLLMLPSTPRTITSTPRTIIRHSISQPAPAPSFTRAADRVRTNSLDKRPSTVPDLKEPVANVSKGLMQNKTFRAQAVDDNYADRMLSTLSPRMPQEYSREATGCIGAGKAWLRGVGQGRVHGRPTAGRPSISSRM